MVKDNKVYICKAWLVSSKIPGDGIYICSSINTGTHEEHRTMYLHPDGQWQHSMKGEEDVDTYSGYFLDVESAVSLAKSLGYDVLVRVKTRTECSR